LSEDIVDAMSTVKELTLSPEGTVPEPLAAPDDEAAADAAADVDVDAADDDEEDEDDEQPAATTAAAAATATRPARWRRLPPRPPLPSCIPYPFRRNAVEYSDYSVVGQRGTRVSLRDEKVDLQVTAQQASGPLKNVNKRRGQEELYDL
jgi:hypothetical protein